jgi:molybdate transport system regulatory protein
MGAGSRSESHPCSYFSHMVAKACEKTLIVGHRTGPGDVTSMVSQGKHTRVRVRLSFANGGSIGEDDIAFIEAVQQCRSISRAGKLLGSCYRIAWLRADALNRMFQEKVIETFPGRHSGSQVTAFGQRLVALFRAIERRAADASRAAMHELEACLNRSFEQGKADDRKVKRA